MKFYSSFALTPENCLSNRAISYGDGVFETMLVSHGEVTLWDFHWQRLQSSLKHLNLETMNEQFIQDKILSLLADNNNYIAKLLVFRDDSKRGYTSQSSKVKFYITVNPYQKVKPINELAISSVTLAKQKSLAGLKHLNRLEQVLAAQELNGSDFKDALMCDENNCIVETISKNVVLIRSNQLYTPLLDNCGVHGVALRWLQSQLDDLDCQLNWKKIEINKLPQYDGMMICNSIQGFSSVTNVDNKIQFKQNSSVAKKIQSLWQKTIDSGVNFQ